MKTITKGLTLGTLLLSTAAMASVTVQPIQSTVPEEAFQTLLVSKLLGELEDPLKKGGARHSPSGESWTDRLKNFFS